MLVAFVFWYVYGCVKQTPFFRKRDKRRTSQISSTAANAGAVNAAAAAAGGAVNAATTVSAADNTAADDATDSATPKDKFIVTVTAVVYLIFPTLVAQAFKIFDCKTIANVQYLAVDLEHPCFKGAHTLAVLTLGAGQLAVFVVGLPLLVLFFLRRNRKAQGGLKRHVVQVRYGLFFAAYTDKMYFWEIVLAARKIGIVGISVFGRSLGTQRQAQLALLILFLCISLEIAGAPFRVVTERHKVLGRLELGSLFTLWGTMWCGTLIFASQAPGDEGFVVFLSVVVAVVNVGIMLWLVFQLIAECAYENKDSKIGRVVRRQSFGGIASWRRRSRASRNETVDSATVGIELSAKSPNPLYSGNGAPAMPTTSSSAARSSVQVSNPTITAPESEAPSAESAARESNAGLVRHFDGSSSRYYWHNGETGESTWEDDWEDDAGATGEHGGHRARYTQQETDEGRVYFVPESGEGKTVWYLPEGAELVD